MFQMQGRKGTSGSPGDGLGLGLGHNHGHTRGHGHGGVFRTLLFGMLLGLAIGLLLAPKPGTESLSSLNDKRSRLMEKMIRKLPV